MKKISLNNLMILSIMACNSNAEIFQDVYVKASNPGLHDQFSNDVALSSKYIAIESHFEDSNAIGVYGDQNNEDGFDSGAVYIIDLNDLIFENRYE